MKKLFYLILGSFIIISCDKQSLQLRKALKVAGNNRPELEEVLNYYSQNSADKWKLKSAEFLISNMPGHYSLTNEATNGYFQKINERYPHIEQPAKHALYCLPKYAIELLDFRGPEDIHCITADFLIKHIDRTFELMDKLPHGKDISFESFCEYILPYRIDNEPLEYLMKDFSPLSLEFVETFSDYGLNQDQWQKIAMGNYLETFEQSFVLPAPMNQTQNMTECIALSVYHLIINRMSGVASSIDFVPHWHNRNGMHLWDNLIDPFRGRVEKVHLADRYAKVYRKTYSHHPMPVSDGKEYIPYEFRSPFMRDVTDEHVKTSDIQIKLTDLKSNPRYIYLAVFSDRNWQPVAWAEREGGKVKFNKVGRGTVYQPIYYDGAHPRVIGYPFILDAYGKMTEIKPDMGRLTDMKLTRKYPLDDKKIRWSMNLEGTILGASNESNFRKADTLFKLAGLPQLPYYKHPVANDKSYRYLKLETPFYRTIEIAELAIHDKQGNRLLSKDMEDYYDWSKENQRKAGMIQTTMIMSAGVTTPSSNYQVGNLENLFDQVDLSYSTISRYLYIDFGKPVQISEIHILPRNDGNHISPGDIYELLFADKDGWNSLGLKKADDYHIVYENIPSNALYWLRNQTKGIEERIFMYKDGKTVFF